MILIVQLKWEITNEDEDCRNLFQESDYCPAGHANLSFCSEYKNQSQSCCFDYTR